MVKREWKRSIGEKKLEKRKKWSSVCDGDVDRATLHMFGAFMTILHS